MDDSYPDISGPSMDRHTHTTYPLSEYPWMTQLLSHPCTIHEYTYHLPAVRVSVDDTVTLISLDHPWTHYTYYLPPFRVSIDDTVTLTSLDHQWMTTLVIPCQSIHG